MRPSRSLLLYPRHLALWIERTIVTAASGFRSSAYNMGMIRCNATRQLARLRSPVIVPPFRQLQLRSYAAIMTKYPEFQGESDTIMELACTKFDHRCDGMPGRAVRVGGQLRRERLGPPARVRCAEAHGESATSGNHESCDCTEGARLIIVHS